MSNIFNIYKGLGKNINVLAIAKFITSIGYFVIPFISLYITQELLLSVTIAGIIVAVANILSIPSALIGGYLSVKFDKKIIAIIPQLLTAILYIGVAVVDYVGLKVGLAILGFCISNMSLPAIDACIADYSKKEDKKRAFSLMYLVQNLGFGIGSLFVGILYNLDADIIFLVDAITTLFSISLLILFLNKVKSQDTIPVQNKKAVKINTIIKNIVFEDKVIYFLFSYLITTLAYCQTSFLLPLFLNYHLHEKAVLIYGILMSINAVGVIILSPILTYVFRNHKTIIALLCADIFFMIGYFTYGINLFYIGLMFSTILWTIGEVLFSINCMPFLLESNKTMESGNVSSVAITFMKVGQVTGSIIGAGLINFVGYRYSWFIISGFIGIAFILVLLQKNIIESKNFSTMESS